MYKNSSCLLFVFHDSVIAYFLFDPYIALNSNETPLLVNGHRCASHLLDGTELSNTNMYKLDLLKQKKPSSGDCLRSLVDNRFSFKHS